MDPFVFKGCFPRNSVNQHPGQTKVHAVEVQGGGFADPPSLPHQGSEIIILWLLCPRWPLTTIPPTSPLSANSRSSRALPLADSLTTCVRELPSTYSRNCLLSTVMTCQQITGKFCITCSPAPSSGTFSQPLKASAYLGTAPRCRFRHTCEAMW